MTEQTIDEAPVAVAPPPPFRTIGWAVKQLQNGAAIARTSWAGKGMFIFLVPGSRFKVNREEINYREHVVVWDSVAGTVVPWLCSQSDLLAVDWCEVKL